MEVGGSTDRASISTRAVLQLGLCLLVIQQKHNPQNEEQEPEKKTRIYAMK